MSQTKEPTDALSVVTREAMQLREDLADVAKQRDDAIDDAIRLMRERNEANERVTDATALLERCADEMNYDEFDDPVQRSLQHDVGAFLSRTPVAVAPSQPAHAEGGKYAAAMRCASASTNVYEVRNSLGQVVEVSMDIEAAASEALAGGPKWTWRLQPAATAPRVCTPAERKVLDACAALPDKWIDDGLALNTTTFYLCKAELARRNTP